jgi:hypothetical protein
MTKKNDRNQTKEEQNEIKTNEQKQNTTPPRRMQWLILWQHDPPYIKFLTIAYFLFVGSPTK